MNDLKMIQLNETKQRIRFQPQPFLRQYKCRYGLSLSEPFSQLSFSNDIYQSRIPSFRSECVPFYNASLASLRFLSTPPCCPSPSSLSINNNLLILAALVLVFFFFLSPTPFFCFGIDGIKFAQYELYFPSVIDPHMRQILQLRLVSSYLTEN